MDINAPDTVNKIALRDNGPASSEAQLEGNRPQAFKPRTSKKTPTAIAIRVDTRAPVLDRARPILSVITDLSMQKFVSSGGSPETVVLFHNR